VEKPKRDAFGGFVKHNHLNLWCGKNV